MKSLRAPPTLEHLRGEIEGLSVRILELLNARANTVLDIAAQKRGMRMPLRDLRREADLLAALAAHNQGPFNDATVRSLFSAIIDASVTLVASRPAPGLQVAAEDGPRPVVEVRGRSIGGGGCTYIAGPCVIESEAQLEEVARRLAHLGVGLLRGGAFKPRTSPYAFQGLGEVGLRLLHAAAQRHDLVTVTEATSPQNVALVARYADIIQVGARNMYNYELLCAAGSTGKPVLLERGLSATLDEWVNAAEYIANAGSQDIILCEPGIRSFTRDTTKTLDLSAVPLLAATARRPIVVDVSQAAGRRDILAPLVQAAFAVGADAVMLDVHPDPDGALSGADQQLSIEGFVALRDQVVRALEAAALDLHNQQHRRQDHAAQRCV